ncbi:MAG: hypothetical protein CM15mP119_0800 [Alphaproteobacteria bacterium]|nr:MAG: hypothetical protein CM15mP119_0800 [Alphaproteobacteria bacterium]
MLMQKKVFFFTLTRDYFKKLMYTRLLVNMYKVTGSISYAAQTLATGNY